MATANIRRVQRMSQAEAFVDGQDRHAAVANVDRDARSATGGEECEDRLRRQVHVARSKGFKEQLTEALAVRARAAR